MDIHIYKSNYDSLIANGLNLIANALKAKNGFQYDSKLMLDMDEPLFLVLEDPELDRYDVESIVLSKDGKITVHLFIDGYSIEPAMLGLYYFPALANEIEDIVEAIEYGKFQF